MSVETAQPEQPVTTGPASDLAPTAPVGGPPIVTQGVSQPSAPAGGTPTPHDLAAAALGQAPANLAGQPVSPALSPEVQRQLDEYRQLQSQLPQLRQYAQLGYQKWQQEQVEQQRQQQAQAQKPWFNAPDFDRSLLEMVERDPATGELRAKPGAPPDAVSKYLQFQRWYSDFQLGFAQNPGKYLEDPVKRLARDEAQRLIDERFGGYEEKVQAGQILQRNQSWIVESGPDGRPQLTQAGQLYYRHLQDAVRDGVQGTEAQHRYALKSTQLDYALATIQQQQGSAGLTQQADAAKQQFAQHAAGPATQPQPAAGLGNGGAAAGPNGSQFSLADMIRRRFKENGITDETLMRGSAV